MRYTLHSAAKENNYRQLRRHIQNQDNPDLDRRDSCNYTALMHAAKQGHAEAVFLLLSAGANTTLTVEIDDSGQRATALTLLMYCCNDTENQKRCILFFSHHSACPNLLADGNLFLSQNNAHNLSQDINKIIEDYENNPAKVAKIISKMPALLTRS
jgi:ankyrin repeat protein